MILSHHKFLSATNITKALLLLTLISASACSKATAGGENAANLPLVEVARDKVTLRAEPDLKATPKMMVNKGLSLPVEERSGAWIKVLTPYGARVWVRAEDVIQADQATSAGTDTAAQVNSDSESNGSN